MAPDDGPTDDSGGRRGVPAGRILDRLAAPVLDGPADRHPHGAAQHAHQAVVVVPPTGTTTTGTSSSATTTTTTTTAPTPAAVLVPRSKVNVAVLNAGGRAGAAVQVAVTLVRLGYPTPYTGNVTLPPDLVPTGTTTAAPAPTTTTAHTGSVPAPARTGTGTTTGASPALPEIVYFRTGGRALASRLAADLGVTNTAPMPSSGVIQAAAPSAQLVVVIGT